MTIQVSELLSSLSGLPVGDNSQLPSLLAEVALPKQFSSALLQQIELLKQSQNTQATTGSLNADLQQLQELAGSIGKELPGLDKQLDIDLEKTLHDLSDVLKNIAAASENGTPSDSQILLSIGKRPLTTDKNKPALVTTDNNEPTTVFASMAAPITADVLVKKIPGLEKSNKEDSLSEIAGNNLSDMDMEQLSDVVMGRLSDTQGKNNSVSSDNRLATEQTSPVSSENNAGNLMGQHNLDDNNNKQLLLNTNNIENDNPGNEGKNPSTTPEKSFPNMVADLGALNRMVATENKSEIPPMSKPFSHPQWSQEFSEKIIWMHNQSVPSAELNLNPKHLGPISIRVDVHQDQATIAFTAQHTVVKDAIENALPKLREMLGAQQLNLTDVNVSQQQSEHKQSQGFFQMAEEQQNQQSNSQNEDSAEPSSRGAVAPIVDEIETGRTIASQGILSIFA